MQVAARNTFAPDIKLADFAVGYSLELFVQDINLRIADRAANRNTFFERQNAVNRGPHRCFRGPVHIPEFAGMFENRFCEVTAESFASAESLEIAFAFPATFQKQ